MKVSLPRPHQKQIEILQGAGRFNVVECGRQFGKSTLSKLLMAYPALQGGAVGYFAPEYKRLLEVFLDMCNRMTFVASINKQEKRINLITGGYVEFWSLEDIEAGRSRKYNRVIIDEAAYAKDLKYSWQRSIRATLAVLNGDAFFFSTPCGFDYFHELYQRGLDKNYPDWKSWRFTSADNPFISPKELKEIERDTPEEIWRQEYLAIPGENARSAFGLKHIEACLVDDFEPGLVDYWGVDLGQLNDPTVIIGIGEDKKLRYYEKLALNLPWEQIENRVIEVVGQGTGYIDATGVGRSPSERICQETFLEPFVYTNKTKGDFMNALVVAVQKHELEIMRGEMEEEFKGFEYKNVGGIIKYDAKGDGHDDIVNAYGLAHYSLILNPIAGPVKIGGKLI